MAVTTGKQGSKIDFSSEIENTLISTVGQGTTKIVAEKPEKKIGRPSIGEVKKISVGIAVDLYDGMEMGATLFFKGNKTAYINALIKKDLEENMEKYQQFTNLRFGA